MSETDSEFMARVLQKALDAWKSRALVAEAEIDRQNNRYSEMSAEADRLCKMVTAFREQDDAIRAEFGGKRDGRPTIECLRKAFNAKWSAEDTLFQATLDMKTGELWAEVERLTRSKAVADDLTQQQSDLALKYVVELNEAAAEVERLTAENAQLRAALLDIDNACKNTGRWSEIVMERIIERVEEIARAALQDKSEGEKG